MDARERGAHLNRPEIRGRERGFTLLELLVVIGIIAILIGIVVAVGASVTSSSKTSLAKDTMRVLDSVLSAYESSTQGIPPPFVNQPGNTNTTQVIVDARTSQNEGVDSLAWFLYQCSGQSGADKGISSISSRYIQPGVPGSATALPTSNPPVFNSVIDPWGRAYRYVHPALDGVLNNLATEDLIGPAPTTPTSRTYSITTINRVATGTANSDGGTSPDSRPYFYSSGPDGDPSTREDNVYLIPPTFVNPE